MIDTLHVETLNFRRCQEHINALVSVSSDVSDWNADNLLFELPRKWDLSFTVATNKIIGYCILSTKWYENVHIHQFMVSKEMRGKEIGTAMMNVAILRSGETPLTLKVDGENVDAIRFYGRFGFEIRHQEEKYLWMKRDAKIQPVSP
jgi:ribosomal protein S18 acetylase RimI-like enzyme